MSCFANILIFSDCKINLKDKIKISNPSKLNTEDLIFIIHHTQYMTYIRRYTERDIFSGIQRHLHAMDKVSITSGFSLISRKLCNLQIYIICHQKGLFTTLLSLLHENPYRNNSDTASYRLKFLYSLVPMFFDRLFIFSHLILTYFTYKSYKMVDNKSKTFLIRHMQKNYITHEDNQY